MSRKDYVAMAAVIRIEMDRARRVGSLPASEAVVTIAFGMADLFAADNPRFDRARFLTACGVN